MENIGGLLKERGEYYQNLLVNEILPYWMDKRDLKTGGFYTCYNVTGDRLLSKDKYVWSQGRSVWIYSKLAMDESIEMDENMRNKCRSLALAGSDFLERYCVLPDGTIAYALDEKNEAKAIEPFGSRSNSTFADCFVASGLAAGSMIDNNEERLTLAVQIFLNAVDLLKGHNFRTAPNVLPNGWNSQAPYMIIINTAYEIGQVLRKTGRKKEMEAMKDICRYGIEMEQKYFMGKDGILLECLDRKFHPIDTLYGRHMNPGHTLECMWFMLQAADWLGLQELVGPAINTIKLVSRQAWDDEYGGMYYYLDRSGGMPTGPIGETEKILSEAALRDWSNKMWWPQLETIYANLMAYISFGEIECLHEYKRYHEYTFCTFPNPDKQVGEWIQIRDRKGKPIYGEVGGRLPVKDPYHLLRTLMLLTNLLSKHRNL